MLEYARGWRGQTAVRERSLWFAPQFDSLPSLSDLNKTALLPREKGKAIIMADFVRHGYLLKGDDVKYNDTKLMVGYETLEFETLIFETSSSWFQKAMCLMSRIFLVDSCI